MFRHVMSIWWTDESSAETRAHAVAQIRGLPDIVPEIRSLELGEDLGMRPDNPHIVFIVDFDDEDGFLAYRENPDHVALGVWMRPIVARNNGVQYLR
jgi:hypothetical protein